MREKENYKKILLEKDVEIAKYKTIISELEKKFSDEIANKQNYYENIIALMPGHVYWLNKDNVFLGCNDLQAKNAGLASRKEIIGKKNKDMIWKNQADELDAINLKVMETGQDYIVEEYAVMTNGAGIYLTQKVPLRNINGEIIGILGISIDITERKKMEEELHHTKNMAEASSHAKTEFIANMSHDLRTPLTGIIGAGQILRQMLDDSETIDLANIIITSSQRLSALLNNILDLISADSINDLEINAQTINLLEHLNNIYQLELPSILAKKLQFNLIIDPAMPQFVITDSIKLESILLNLIGNAIKFTHEGYVELEVKLINFTNDEAEIKFIVSDTGIGIPEGQCSLVFERFFRANPAYEGKYTGSGIGLYMVKKYVTLLGGDIKFNSDENEGSEFYFTLKLKTVGGLLPQIYNLNSNQSVQLESQLKIHETLAKTQHKQSGAVSILLIENDEIATIIVKNMLQQHKINVDTVADGQQALALAKKVKYDLIIADVGLPNLTGDEFTAAFRSWERATRKKLTPIVGLTAHADKDLIEICLTAGMNAVYNKPIDQDMIAGILQFIEK